ncbi:unnamed protein product [Blepharisma stoltei]|uniref:Uncharacterized protein n=1 Tax=Blepharisma stoltei TaxID=1481888 RepID=A0AAU9K0E8_9CILI|nr:unnamed protein product [Blepharisma stoltei]
MQAAEMPAQSVEYWKSKLPEFKNKILEFSNLALPKYHNYKLDTLREEGLIDKTNVDTQIQAIKKIISTTIDSSQLPLSQLLDAIKRNLVEDASDIPLSTEELTDIINQIASRVPIGIIDKKKNTYEDTDPLCMWCWELDEYPQPSCVKQERNLIGKAIRSLNKLIKELEKNYPNAEVIPNLYDSANKAVKNYEKKIAEDRERKRVRDEKETEKQMKKLKIEEKKKQAEEEKMRKLKEKEQMEEEKIKKQKEKEEEIRRKQVEKEEDLKKKQAQLERTPEKSPEKKQEQQSIKKVMPMLKMESFFKPVKAEIPLEKENRNILQKVLINPSQDDTVPGDLNSWKAKWKKDIKHFKPKSHFIYIQDSALKPYFEGFPKIVEVKRNPYFIYQDVNYDIDSEEEYEEKFGEDIEKEDDEEESDSYTESEESDVKFVVPDGYLSNDEIPEGEEGPEVISYKPPEEILPMKIITLASDDAALLCSLKAVNLQNIPLPIIYKVEKTPLLPQKPPKKTIDDLIEEFKTVAQGKNSKKEIVAYFAEKYPEISKLSVSKKIQELLVRTKIGNDKQKYYLKSSLEVADPFSSSNQGITTANPNSQAFVDASTGVSLPLPFSPCQPAIKGFLKPKVTASQTTGSTQS